MNFQSNINDFKAEMKRISWPSRSITLNATRGVLFVILIVAVQLILGGTNEIYANVLPEFITKII